VASLARMVVSIRGSIPKAMGYPETPSLCFVSSSSKEIPSCPHSRKTCSAILSEANLELEVDGESRVANTHFLSVRQEFVQLALQVGASLRLETGRCRVVERLLLGSDRGLLELCFGSLGQVFNKVLQSPLFLNCDLLGQVATHRAVVLLFVLKRVRVDAVVAAVHHVVVGTGIAQEWVGASRDFEGFVAARSCDDCVGRGDSGNDVLDHTLGHRVRNSRDIELLCTLQGLCEQPRDVFCVIRVESNV
jgi:hypothetical protein